MDILQALYAIVGGNTHASVALQEVHDHAQLSSATLYRALLVLEQQGLVVIPADPAKLIWDIFGLQLLGGNGSDGSNSLDRKGEYGY